MQETWVWPLGQEAPLGRKWQPSPVFLSGESHGERSLAGYSLWSHRESDTPECLDNNNNKQWSELWKWALELSWLPAVSNPFIGRLLLWRGWLPWQVRHLAVECPRHSREPHVEAQARTEPPTQASQQWTPREQADGHQRPTCNCLSCSVIDKREV